MNQTNERTISLGEKFGNYRVEELIGRGGISEVWRAISERSGNNVALKFLNSSHRNWSTRRELIKREIAAKRINHHAVVDYFELLISEGAPDVIVMEYIDGDTLFYFCENNTVDSDVAIDLLKKLVSGMKAVHDAGVIHRDLSPENIILRSGQISKPVIIDFGVSLDYLEGAKTVTGNFAAKYFYAPPEQLEGRIDRRSDIYSLGCVILRCVLGKSVISYSSMMDLINKKQQPFDTSGVGQPLRAVLDRMCAPEPRDRFQSMDEILEVLEEGSESLPPIPKEPSLGDNVDVVDGKIRLALLDSGVDGPSASSLFKTLKFECRNFLDFGGVSNTQPILHKTIEYFHSGIDAQNIESLDPVDFGVQVAGLREKFKYLRPILEEENPDRVGFVASIVRTSEELCDRIDGWKDFVEDAQVVTDDDFEGLETGIRSSIEEFEKKGGVVEKSVTDRLRNFVAHGTRASVFAAARIIVNMARAVFSASQYVLTEMTKSLARNFAGPLSAVVVGSAGAVLLRLSEIAPSAFGWLKAWIEAALKIVG